AGDADDEEVAEALVKDELGRDPGVRAPQHDGEGLLRGRELGATGVEAGEGIRLAGGETAVSVAETGQRLSGGEHQRLGLLSRLAAQPPGFRGQLPGPRPRP